MLATIALVGIASCGPPTPVGASGRPVSAYSGRATELFDDSIDPRAVGMAFDKGPLPKADPVLRERAQLSDAVLRVKVQTVTTRTDGPEKIYQVGLRTVEKLAGSHAPSVDFTVGVQKASESHGIVKTFESRLIGYPFIAFVREFVRSDGDRDIHFHFAPDTKEVRDAVGDAIVLGEVEKR